MNKYSKCAKLNKVLCKIDDKIRSNYDNEMDMIRELTRYKTEFWREADYNYAQYGCCLIYYYDVRQLYKDCGYKSIDKYSDEKIWNIYKRHVGYVIKKILVEYPTNIGYFKRINNITNNN